MKTLMKYHLISILCYILIVPGGLLIAVLIGKIFNIWNFWITVVAVLIAPLVSAANRIRALKYVTEYKPKTDFEMIGKKIFIGSIFVEIIFSVCCLVMVTSAC